MGKEIKVAPKINCGGPRIVQKTGGLGLKAGLLCKLREGKGRQAVEDMHTM